MNTLKVIIKSILFVVFVPLAYMIDFIYISLFKIPANSHVGWRALGIARIVATIVFLAHMYSIAEYRILTRQVELQIWLENHSDLSFGFWKGVFIVLYGLLALNVLLSAFVASGMCINYNGYIEHEGGGSGYDAIDEALGYQEGVANMQSTRGKLDEYASTSFLTKGKLRDMSASPQMKEALGFLNGKLSMQSTAGKLRELKNTFGG